MSTGTAETPVYSTDKEGKSVLPVTTNEKGEQVLNVPASPVPTVDPAAAAAAAPAGKRKRYQESAPVIRVPLLRIDNTVYSNYRQQSSNERIMGYTESIRKQGLQQNLVAGEQPDGRLGLSCGFQRFESLQRLALEDVVEEYNKAMGYEPKDAAFVHLSGETEALNPRGVKDWVASTLEMQKNRRRIRDTSPEWAKKYDEALAKFEVNVQVKKYKTALEAMADNIAENENRDNPSLADRTARIVLLLGEGMSTGAVAVLIDKSAPTVSHYKRIAELVPYLSGLRDDFLKTCSTPQTEYQQVFLRKMDTCIREVDRRWKLAEADPAALQFQVLRELSSRIDPAKDDKRLPLHVIFDIVAMTCRIGKDLNATNDPAYDMSTFKARMQDIVSADKIRQEEAEKVAKGETATSAATPATVDPATVDPATTPAGATAPESKLNVDMANAADVALLQSMQQATGAAPQPVASLGQPSAPTDLERQARTDAANAALDAAGGSVVDSALTAPLDTDDLMTNLAIPSEKELEAEAGKAPTSPEDGAMRAKTQEATKSRYQPLAAEKIEGFADTLIKDMNDPEQAEVTTPYDAISYMGGSKQLYYVLGLNAKSDVVNEALINYAESYGAYLAKLEEVASKLPVDQKQVLMALKPAIPTITFPKEG